MSEKKETSEVIIGRFLCNKEAALLNLSFKLYAVINELKYFQKLLAERADGITPIIDADAARFGVPKEVVAAFKSKDSILGAELGPHITRAINDLEVLHKGYETQLEQAGEEWEKNLADARKTLDIQEQTRVEVLRTELESITSFSEAKAVINRLAKEDPNRIKLMEEDLGGLARRVPDGGVMLSHNYPLSAEDIERCTIFEEDYGVNEYGFRNVFRFIAVTEINGQTGQPMQKIYHIRKGFRKEKTDGDWHQHSTHNPERGGMRG